MTGPQRTIHCKGNRPLLIAAVLVFFALTVYAITGASAGPAGENKPKPPRLVLGETTILDNETGLMWALNGNLSDMTYSWAAAGDYVAELNRERFGGYRDWRLPKREELLTLAQLARERGYDGSTPERTVAAGLQLMGAKKVQPAEYWSSTVNLYDASEVWFVNMRNGTAGAGEKTLYLSVWPVRTVR